jgi:nucleoside-diphosphate-sugar epimerase
LAVGIDDASQYLEQFGILLDFIEFGAAWANGAGQARKLLNVGRLNALGWRARMPFKDGLLKNCRWFLDNLEKYIERQYGASLCD